MVRREWQNYVRNSFNNEPHLLPFITWSSLGLEITLIPQSISLNYKAPNIRTNKLRFFLLLFFFDIIYYPGLSDPGENLKDAVRPLTLELDNLVISPHCINKTIRVYPCIILSNISYEWLHKVYNKVRVSDSKIH